MLRKLNKKADEMVSRTKLRKAELEALFVRFLDENRCPVHVANGDVKVMEYAMPSVTPGVYAQLRTSGEVYIGQAADILHRQREHLASGVKLWALGVWPIHEASDRRRYAFETELIARALRKGYVLANIQKCEGVKQP